MEDVGLLVKRKDALLQMFYVGLLRIERDVHVCIKGFDVDSRNSNKKDTQLSTKILNKAHIKSVL